MRSLYTATLALPGAAGLTEAASAGCGKSPPTSGTKSMTVNGKNRQYILQLPSNYDSSKPHKLVFGYHWRDGSMNDVANGQFYGLRPLAGDSTVFIAPNGLNAGWANNGGEDITFTDQLLKSVQDTVCIDEGNIFATGWSYGGAMSFSVACSRPDVFKAVAVIAGAQLSGCSGGTTPVPYLGIHGAADNVLPIAAGRQLRDKYLGLNGCASKNAQEPGAGAGNHIKTVYECRANQPVWWIAHGGGHVPDPSDSNGNKWAPGETWSFFTEAIGGGGGGGGGGSNPGTPTTTTRANPSPTTNPGGGNCVAKYAQCGGQGWSGATCCQSGSTCKVSNEWYSQCV
ncbi:fungal cellulose binding domain-containing protein [Apiospora hydei]|uniref:Feruloyl esterase C n=1 Tax=Apiospora hydei TaxID=1337664 RepID=A0ABR1V7U6_9PEZI